MTKLAMKAYSNTQESEALKPIVDIKAIKRDYRETVADEN
jgi:hypothetical protein